MPDLEWAATPWLEPNVATQKCGHSVTRQGRDADFCSQKYLQRFRNTGASPLGGGGIIQLNWGFMLGDKELGKAKG